LEPRDRQWKNGPIAAVAGGSAVCGLPGFAHFFEFFSLFSKIGLTVPGMRSYTTAIDGVAADFAAGADASPFEPKWFYWLGEPGSD
jgi:hypothetical protein